MTVVHGTPKEDPNWLATLVLIVTTSWVGLAPTAVFTVVPPELG